MRSKRRKRSANAQQVVQVIHPSRPASSCAASAAVSLSCAPRRAFGQFVGFITVCVSDAIVSAEMPRSVQLLTARVQRQTSPRPLDRLRRIARILFLGFFFALVPSCANLGQQSEKFYHPRYSRISFPCSGGRLFSNAVRSYSLLSSLQDIVCPTKFSHKRR